MMNNMDNNIAEEQKETKSLAEIMESFGKAFLKLWWIAVILMVVAGFLGYYKYRTGYTPMYQSEVTFSITSPEYDGPDETYTDNNQLASTLSVSFNYLINNEVFYEIIKKDLGLSYVPSVITVAAVENTNIISIKATGTNAEMNSKVIDSVINNYSEVVEFVLGETKLTVLERPSGGDTAINPYQPVNQTLKYGFIGLVLGLLPSIIFAFFVKTIESRDDIEKYLSVTCFGALPVVGNSKKDKKYKISILNKEIGFRYLEAMRTITSRCERELERKNSKVILVTSTQAGEGKTTFALNLAYSLSKLQNKVMLIEGNIRRPDLRSRVNPELLREGLASYDMEQFLNKEVKSSDAIANIKDTRVIMLAPDLPVKDKTAVDCLNSDAMESFINECRDVVDYVIIDAPACSEVSDAAVWAKYSDSVVYVVKEDGAKVNKILDTIQEFSYTRVPIIGCVLNGTAGKLKLSYGYGYGKHYGGYNYGGYYRSYGYYSYGYGSYGKYSDKEFRSKPRKVTKSISLTTTDEQKKALENERKNKGENKNEDE